MYKKNKIIQGYIIFIHYLTTPNKYSLPVIITSLITLAISTVNAQSVDTILWDSNISVPKIDEIPLLKEAEFYSIKKRQKEVDQYNFLHGVALAWHKKKLYASFGHNKGDENTASEEAGYCISSNKGQSWSKVMAIDSGIEENHAISHGVLLSSEEKLWAFHGSFYNQMEQVHMRAYLLDEKTGKWQKMGVVAKKGFWPLDQPTLMDNGNWIIGGISVGKTTNIHGPNHSAVAISHGSNLLKWDVVKINKGDGVNKSWGESSNIVNGNRILNISRYGYKKLTLVAQSEDFGRTWTNQCESNLPMATSKLFCGILSTGHSYLICNTASDIKHRNPLTIAISQPDETFFSSIFCIRDGVITTSKVESSPNSALSYPYAVEHDGKLYVAYSNDGGRGKNLNSAELAVIPISELIKSSNERGGVCQNPILNSIPDTLYYNKVDEGHLQGIASDYKSALYWSNTALLVKTDFQGNVLKSIKVPSHHGDLDYCNGKIYVAVNLGLFNEEEGLADSWIYVYDEHDLSLTGKYPVPEVIHGAGGLAIHGNRIMVVGGLPDNGKYNENFVYEYTMDFKFVKTHKLKTGYTHLGIQTASYHKGFWYFGCYGKAAKSLSPLVLKTKLHNDTLKIETKCKQDFTFGMVGLNDNKWLVSNRTFNNTAHVIRLK